MKQLHPPSNLIYVNAGATRNKKCTAHLEREILQAVLKVYGPDHVAKIYSGGQCAKGSGGKRTGSIRHDDLGQGGRAADVYIYDADGTKQTGVKLAPLVQFWVASKIGGVGVEMRVGGIHLDQWSTPPPGGGMFWFYAYGQDSVGRRAQVKAAADGRSGHMPKLIEQPVPQPTGFWAAILSLFGVKK